MIQKEVFQEIKEKYAQCSSWAVWEEDRFDLNGHGYYLNTAVQKLNEDLDDQALQALGLHADAVLIALNFGMRDESKEKSFMGINEQLNDIAFASFHEELDIHRYSGDRRQKLAYRNTPLWGAYMTDLMKYNKKGEIEAFKESDSASETLNKLLKDELYMQVQMVGLIEELKILGADSPVLYAVGSKVYQALKPHLKFLKKELGSKTELVQLPHYSRANAISDEEYVKRVHAKII